MPDPTPYTVGGIEVSTGSALTVQIPPRVFLGRLTGLLFDTNKTFLLARSLKGIKGLKRFFDAHPGAQVLVVGHTDTVGSEQSNLTLSIERARSIAAYLKDDVDTWMEYYPGRTGSALWGTVEDQHMLSELADANGAKFYTGAIDGNSASSREAVRRFQGSKGLNADGQAGQRTRKALVTAYMQIEGTTLPQGTVLQTHGCGKFHLAVPTPDETPEQRNRRAEVFFFESRIDPPPRPRCPAPGCPEQPQWLRRTVQTFDLDHAPGALEVTVRDPQGQVVASASVHASGPTAADGQTDAAGSVLFSDLIPGSYTVLGQKQGFRDGTASAQVAESASAGDSPGSTVVQLQAGTGNLIVHVVDNLGGALANASVSGTPASGTAPASQSTNAQGNVTFNGLEVGAAQITVRKSGFLDGTGTATVTPGGSVIATVVLQPSAVDVVVRVVSSTGANLAGATVNVDGPLSTTGTTDANGTVTFHLPPGQHQIAATLDNFSSPPAVGVNVVANGSNGATITLTPNNVVATISALPLLVVLKKHNCNPARKQVGLGITGTFTGTGTGRFTRSLNNVKFFTLAIAGTEVTFNGTDNVFTAAQLTAGVPLFAEGGTVSAAQQDIDLRLELFVGTNAFGTPATGKATCVELTIDLFQSRTVAAGDPAPMTANAKTDTGRFVHVQDTAFQQGRAMLVVRQVQPSGFTGDLTLQRVPIPAGSGAVRLFPANAENHLAGETETALPHPITAADLGAAPQVAGRPAIAFFVEGRTACGALRDLTLQLGIQGGEADGDRATFTVVQFTNLTATVPSTPSPRTGAVAAHPAFTLPGGGPNDFSEDFAVNRPLVLLRNSVIAGTPVVLSVTVQPAGTPVSWSALRDTRPAPNGDDPVVVALAANAAPTVATTGATTGSLLTDAVGSFRVRAFVNNNATPAFDRDPVAATSFAPDPFILMNLVLVHVRLDSDDVQLHQTLAAVANGGGIFASSGVFSVLAQPNNTALHHNARCTIIGGGRNGRLGTDRVFGGWMQDAVLAIGHRGTYVDNTVAPPVPHPLITVQENPRRGALTGCLGQSTITSRNNANHGEQLRIQAVDSPAMPYPAAHPGFPAALLTFFHFEMRFRAVMAFWTNNANPPNGATSGDPAERR